MELAADLPTAHSFIKHLSSENTELRSEISDLRTQLQLKDERIQKLLQEQFGRSSERRVVDDGTEQLSLQLGETLTPVAEPAEMPGTEIKPHKRRSPKQVIEGILDSDGKFPAELPRVPEVLDEGEEAGRVLFVKITERLEIEPAKLFVRKITRVVRKKDDGSISQPHVPEVITARSTVGPSFLAYIIISKFMWHLPLHRQEQMFRQLGIRISRDRLIRYVIDVAKLLRPLYRLLLDSILEQEAIFADETPILVGKGEKGNKKYTQSYFWPFLGGNQIAFLYSDNRGGKKIKELLSKFEGYLQVDGYRVYEQVAKANDQLTLVFCWAHARRYFIDAEKYYPEEAKIALRYIRALYRVEALIRKKNADDKEILRLRSRYAQPILKLFKTQLDNWAAMPMLLPKSSFAEAVFYTLGRWKGLMQYADNPILSIDSNPIERQIRPVTLGRKNWLFCASEVGAESACILYSLIASAKLAGLNPYDYLLDLLGRIAETKQTELSSLLPSNWTPLTKSNDDE